MPSFSELWNQEDQTQKGPNNFERLWNQNSQPVGPPAPPDPFRMFAGRATQGVADILGGFTGFLNDRNINTESFFKPAREAARTQKALTGKAKIYAAEAGLADLGDAIINTPAGIIQQTTGVAPEKRWRSDMAGFIENFPAAREAKEILPEAFNSYKTTAGFLAPLPGGGVAKTVGMAGKYIPAAAKWAKAVKDGNKVAQVADMAAMGGAVGGAMSVGQQVKENRNIDPIEALKGVGYGAALGGGLGAGAHGAGALFEKLWNKIPKRQPQISQEVAGQILPREGPMNAADMEHAGMIDREALDPEDLAALDQLQRKFDPPGPDDPPPPGAGMIEPPPAPPEPAPFVSNADRPVQKFEPDPTVPEDPIIKYREYETERYAAAFEPLGSQTAHNGKSKGRSEDYYTETRQLKAQDLTDAELDAAWNELSIDLRRPSMKNQKKKIEAQQKIISYEQMRRADRRKNGMPENWKKDEFESADTDDLLLMLTGDDELQAQKALAELSRREQAMADPPAPEPMPEQAPAVEKPRIKLPSEEAQGNLQGERRSILGVDENGKQILGRDRVGQAPPIESYSDAVLPPELRALKLKYAQDKANAAYHSDQLNQINDILIDRFGTNGEAQLGPFKLTRTPGKRELNKFGEDLKNRIKAQIDEELPAYIETNRKGGGVRATVDEPSISRMPKAVVPGGITEAEAIALLEKYHGLAEQAKAAQKETAALFKGPNDEDALLLAQDRLRNELGDPNASLQSQIPVMGPDGQTYNVLVEVQNPRQELPLLWEQFSKAKKEGPPGPRGGKKMIPQTEEEFFGDYAAKMGIDTPYTALAKQAREGFERLQAEIAEALKPGKPTNTLRPDKTKLVRTAQAAGGLAGFGLMSIDQQAQAAGVTDNRGNPVIGTGTLVGGALIMASLAHRFGPQAIRNFAKWSGSHAASIYKDTLDHIDHLDRVMASMNGPHTPANQKILAKGNKLNGKTLARNIWEHNTAAVMSNWGVDWTKNAKGVKWDGQTTKARAMALLRSRQVTSADALRGKAGTLFEDMSQQQRDAAVGYFLNQKTLAQKVNRFEAEMKAAGVEQLAQMDPNTQNALAAFSYLKDAIAPTSKAFEDGLIDAYHKGLSNAMDFYFFLNPKHHLLNLTDSFIGGGSRTGATRIARAWQWLGTDKDIQKVFADSNIVGSYRAEQVNLASKNANSKALFQHDFASDRVNANRVALGSLIQFSEDNAKRIAQTGYKGDSKQFVKDLFDGKLDPTLAMDAGVHMTETLSRTLGVDPYRLNTDWLSRQKISSSLGVFVKQPARISRLAFTYAKNGEYGKLAQMIGMMAFFGGSAAIPIELKKVWENVDPNSYFQMAGFLDKYNPFSMATGMNASKKLQWGINPIGMTTTNPAWTTAYGMAQDVQELYKAYTELASVPGGLYEGVTDPRMQGERDKVAGKLQKFVGGLTQIVLNRIPFVNFPTGEATRLTKQLTPSVTGRTDITYYRDGENRPYAPKEQGVPLEKLGMSRLNPVLNAVLPGEMSGVYQNQNAVLERKIRQERRQRVPEPQMGYHDPLMQALATRK